MVRFTRISLQNIRIIQHAEIEPVAGLNLIAGENGSGKTSLLEGIHVLGSGNSFRTTRTDSIIRTDESEMRAVAGYSYAYDNSHHQVGVSRTRNGGVRARIDRTDSRRLADLSKNIPLIALHPESHQILSGGPSIRRKLLDWGVFHVEQSFLLTWRNYKRLLDQRNAALKSGVDKAQLSVWDQGLAEHGEELTRFRIDYLQQLQPVMSSLLESMGLQAPIILELHTGWRRPASLLSELQNSASRDLTYRTTHVGPHRAEIAVTEGGADVRHTYSRGQLKLFAYLLRIAQAELLRRKSQINCVFLCDDLPAELDKINRNKISDMLQGRGYQVFATSVDESVDNLGTAPSRMFHVEHGRVRQVV